MSAQILCDVSVSWTNHTGETIRRQQGKKTLLAIGRDDDRRVVLHYQTGKRGNSDGALVVQGGVVLHTRMLDKGLATIRLVSQLVTVMVSGADPSSLRQFFCVLADKLPENNAGSAPQLHAAKVSVDAKQERLARGRAQHLAALVGGALRVRQPGNLTEISPPRPDAQCPESPSPTAKRAKITIVPVKSAVCLDDLNSEQRRVYDMVMHGKSVFFSGGAGTGKSFLLRKILDSLPAHSTVATAPTGVAACHIGGMTLHAFAGLRPDGTAPRDVAKMRLWQTTKVLILDEISMVSGTFFDQVELAARRLKNPQLIFGGMQLVVCGDFFQLPPVCKDSTVKDFCFTAKTWGPALPCQVGLHEVFRQQDPRFVATLNRVRVGRLLDSDVRLLQATARNDTAHHTDGRRATQLCTHVHESNAINATKLSALSGAVHKFEAIDSGSTEVLNRVARMPPTVYLKEGALVLLNKNLDVRNALVNGTRGVVTGFNASGLPLIKFGTREPQVVYTDENIVTDHSGRHVRKQLPLDLGYAISIHKSQGMTLDFVEVNLSNTFECGQAYVALSRAQSLEGLCVRGFSLQSVRADGSVQAFYETLAP